MWLRKNNFDSIDVKQAGCFETRGEGVLQLAGAAQDSAAGVVVVVVVVEPELWDLLHEHAVSHA
jgi:hypothetical protein